MVKDLCGHSLRGLVLSVAGLAWHGLGFDTGCPHREFMRVLDYLRLRGPMSKSDLHHRGHIENSKTRDKLVERHVLAPVGTSASSNTSPLPLNP